MNILLLINDNRRIYKANFVICFKRIIGSGFCVRNGKSVNRKTWDFINDPDNYS